MAGEISVSEKMVKMQRSVQGMFVINFQTCSCRKDSAVVFLHAGWGPILLGRWTKI